VKHFRVVASCACALALLMCMLVVTSARAAETADRTYHFDIPAEALSQALRAFGQTAGEQIIFTEDLVSGLKFSGLRGDLSAEVALQRLLQGTGLVSERTPAGVIMIRRAARSTDVDDQKTSPSAPQSSSDAVHVAQADQGQATSPSTVEKEDKQPAKKKPVPVEEVIVTGSRIPRAAQESAQDVKIFTAEQIEQSGQNTVADFFNTLSDVSVNSAENTPLLGTVPGPTTVQLHGLPIGTTLVLINGRRVEVSGSQGSNGSNFFDLNSIPLSAVDRIEVVSEGSSAIYGSDAIAGVVNVILKKDFTGVDANVKDGWASDTHETDASLAWGQQWDKGAVSIIGSYQTRSELLGFDRAITANDNKTPFGGTNHQLDICNPGTIYFPNGFSFNGQPPVQLAAVPAGYTGTPSIQEFKATAGVDHLCNIGGYADLIPSSDRYGLFAAGNVDVAPTVDVFAELMLSYVQQNSEGVPPFVFAFPGFSQVTASASNPYNPFGQPVGMSYLFTQIGRQAVPVDTTFFRPLMGARGTLFDLWRWELAGWDAEDRSTFTQVNSINADAVQAALNSPNPQTALNVFTAGPAGSPALLQSLVTDQKQDFLGQTLAVNGFVQGPVLQMPSGALDLVIGTEYDRDKLYFDQINVSGVAPNTHATYDRDQYAFFSEARLPILGNRTSAQGSDKLAVTLAGRYDHYANYGSKTTPQFGVEWRPSGSLLLRSTYAGSFKAPGLFNLFEPTTTFQSVVSDPKLGNQSEAINVLTGGNPKLRPETGLSRTYGLVYSSQVIPDLQLSVTRWEVNESNSIQQIGIQALADNENLFPGYITRAPGQNGQPGPITEINSAFVNFGEISVAGIDFRVNYKLSTRWGDFNPSVSLTDTTHYTTVLVPGQPPADRDSVANDDGNWAPRWKGAAALVWKLGGWTTSVDGRYVGRYQDYDRTAIIGNFWLFDGYLNYAIGQLLPSSTPALRNTQLSLGGVNIFNTLPQFSNFDFGSFGYDPAQGDIRGRFLYLKFNTKM
jgi:iron complex outermembrane receptor protein